MNSPVNVLPVPQIYYHDQNQQYYSLDDRGKWIKVSETSVVRELKGIGFSGRGESGNSEVDQALTRIQKTQNVGYAARLAGHDAGSYEICGKQVLVTESPRLIEPKAGEWPLLRQILDGMLNVEPEDQRPYLYGWLKLSLMSLRSRKGTQAQVLAFAGPIGSGKSLLQKVITELFGGRSAKPYAYMAGKTDFNSDLFQAEHLMVEDDCESIDYKSRRHFGAHIKQVAVNETQFCHGKNKEGLTLTPWWRMTISLNDDPERLLVLPPVADDIHDKIMMFKAVTRPMPMPTETPDEKEAFSQALLAELPAFVDFLLKYEIPEGLRSKRYGVNHYHHPDLLRALNEASPETRLLELIDRELFPATLLSPVDPASPRNHDFTALELETRLKKDNGTPTSREAYQLLQYHTNCGAYLGRLAKSHPDRVTPGRIVRGTTHWTIHPPPVEETTGVVSKEGGGVEQESYLQYGKK